MSESCHWFATADGAVWCRSKSIARSPLSGVPYAVAGRRQSMPGRGTPLGAWPLGAANSGARGYRGPAETVYLRSVPRSVESVGSLHAGAGGEFLGGGREAQGAGREFGRALWVHGIRVVG